MQARKYACACLSKLALSVKGQLEMVTGGFVPRILERLNVGHHCSTSSRIVPCSRVTGLGAKRCECCGLLSSEDIYAVHRVLDIARTQWPQNDVETPDS